MVDYLRSFVFHTSVFEASMEVRKWRVVATLDEVSKTTGVGFNEGRTHTRSRKYEDRLYSAGDEGTGTLQWCSNVHLSFRDEVLFESQNECVDAV